LIEPGAGEASRFAVALHRLLEDSRAAAAMGRAGREKVERDYDIGRARADYRALFDSA
jgi:hypothetical protein